jgi:RNA polymerase sigma-70 factor (ECF subfamily)
MSVIDDMIALPTNSRAAACGFAHRLGSEPVAEGVTSGNCGSAPDHCHFSQQTFCSRTAVPTGNKLAPAHMVSHNAATPDNRGITLSPSDSFEDVMARLRAGDADAAATVFDRFAGRLVALARTRLDARLRTKVDPEDVLKSVYKSFFLQQAVGQLKPVGWDSLWTLLTVLTVRKCGRWRERFGTLGRAVGREIEASEGDGRSGWELEALAGEPGPEEAAELADLVESLLRDLEGRDRDIVSLRLQGYTPAEIACQLNRPERTVFRVLDRVKKSLRRFCDGDNPPH